MDCTAPMEPQILSWQPLRDGDGDVALISEAGSGKTLAYLVPLIDRLLEKPGTRRLQIVVPTSDLCSQVMRVAEELCSGVPELTLASADDAARARFSAAPSASFSVLRSACSARYLFICAACARAVAAYESHLRARVSRADDVDEDGVFVARVSRAATSAPVADLAQGAHDDSAARLFNS